MPARLEAMSEFANGVTPFLGVGARLLAQFFCQNPQILDAAAAEQSREFIGIEGGLWKDWQLGRTPVQPGQPEETLEHPHVLEPRLSLRE
jgi:hypothetical protein